MDVQNFGLLGGAIVSNPQYLIDMLLWGVLILVGSSMMAGILMVLIRDLFTRRRGEQSYRSHISKIQTPYAPSRSKIRKF